MKLNVELGLPFVSVDLIFRGEALSLGKVLLDTGSASTIFNANRMGTIDVIPEKDDILGFDFISEAKLIIDSKELSVYPYGSE